MAGRGGWPAKRVGDDGKEYVMVSLTPVFWQCDRFCLDSADGIAFPFGNMGIVDCEG